jgi:transposase
VAALSPQYATWVAITDRTEAPNKLRQFARACGVLAKNDRLDARLIAEYVAIMPTRVVQRDAAVEKLAEIVTMRRQLCDEHVAVENQAAHLEDAMLRRLSKRRLIRLEADIRLLDKRLAEMVATNAAFAQLYELLTSMPGVGPVLAFTLIALASTPKDLAAALNEFR